MDQDVLIMAKTLFGEARGEGLKGIEAVANVIINRVKHAQQVGSFWWGNTIREVCQKPFQFSCWICERVARRAIKGLLPDCTKGATHYHHKSIHPKWAHAAVPCAEIGNHLFYAEV